MFKNIFEKSVQLDDIKNIVKKKKKKKKKKGKKKEKKEKPNVEASFYNFQRMEPREVCEYIAGDISNFRYSDRKKLYIYIYIYTYMCVCVCVCVCVCEVLLAVWQMCWTKTS